MKNLLSSLLCSLLSISTASYAQEVNVEKTVPVEQKIVELHITQRPLGEAAETKRSRKKIENLGKAVCSGSFITDTGDIITAGHCVQGAEAIEVITHNNEIYSAVVVATSSIHDLALIHIDKLGTPYFKLTKNVTRGERIFILGSPLGITDTLSTGVVAKLGGDITLVDCGALPGNSGSVVFDDNGYMIGILTAGYRVDFGTTHLNLAQSADAVWFFLVSVFSQRK